MTTDNMCLVNDGMSFSVPMVHIIYNRQNFLHYFLVNPDFEYDRITSEDS